MFKAAKVQKLFIQFSMNWVLEKKKKLVFPLQNNTLQYIASIQDVRVKKKSLMWQAK